MVEQASKVAATSVCPQEKFQLRPDSPGGSPRSVRGSEPASLQISASARFGLREISHVSFRAECLFPVALWLSGFIGLRSQMIWGGLSSRCRTPGQGGPMWGLNLWLLGENRYSFDYPPICGSPIQGCGSWLYCVSTPPIYVIMVPSLYL